MHYKLKICHGPHSPLTQTLLQICEQTSKEECTQYQLRFPQSWKPSAGKIPVSAKQVLRDSQLTRKRVYMLFHLPTGVLLVIIQLSICYRISISNGNVFIYSS